MLTVKNRRYILAILICMIAAGAHASRSDTIFSYYRKGEHVTHGCIYADARKEVCMDMVADLISQFRGNPDQLFGWAFKGLGRQEGDGNEKNEVLIQLNQALYDPSTQIGTLVMDIIVPGLTTFDDVNIESRVTQKDLNDTVSEVSVDIFYSNSLLKKAFCHTKQRRGDIPLYRHTHTLRMVLQSVHHPAQIPQYSRMAHRRLSEEPERRRGKT